MSEFFESPHLWKRPFVKKKTKFLRKSPAIIRAFNGNDGKSLVEWNYQVFESSKNTVLFHCQFVCFLSLIDIMSIWWPWGSRLKQGPVSSRILQYDKEAYFPKNEIFGILNNFEIRI